ncbi:MAG: DUF4342 domain-containing protein [Firmicutes bacterium]|nr:DUF4342 domain-containing protein [Bacillota bacterium]
MKVDLEKIDQLRARIDLTYEEAAAYLEAADGDLVQALVMAERDLLAEGDGEATGGGGQDQGWIDRVTELVKRGSSIRLVVEREGTQLANIPVAAGVVGAIWAPQLAAVGAIAALASKCSVRLESPSPGSPGQPGQPN